MQSAVWIVLGQLLMIVLTLSFTFLSGADSDTLQKLRSALLWRQPVIGLEGPAERRWL